MLVSDYNYNLPEERIAKYPPKERGSTRLLVLNRQTGEMENSYYRNLVDFLNPGDVIILNDTRVMQSRLFVTLPDGRKRELVVLEKHASDKQRVMYRGKLHEGDILKLDLDKIKDNSLINRGDENHVTNSIKDALSSAGHDNGDERRVKEPNKHNQDSVKHIQNISTEDILKITIRVEEILGNGIAVVSSNVELTATMEAFGSVPLPPYLHRDAEVSDQKRYQTVWAKNLGSAAAPTASLNMTNELLDKLSKKGVIIKYLTLHVGLGTFLPIRSDKVEEHKMHSEWFNIPDETLSAIRLAKQEHHRVVAVGTTVTRTLEYYAKTGKTSGEDDIFIYPGFKFEIVDALLTNFHAPKSTVLMLTAAFASWEKLHAAYQYAVSEKYNFLSYGDSMLIC